MDWTPSTPNTKGHHECFSKGDCELIDFNLCDMIQYILHFFFFFWGISSVQLLSRVQLFATPWTVACRASLSVTKSQSLFKLMSIELVMPSNHLILLSSPSLSTFNLSQHQGLFQWVNSLHQVAKVLEFKLQHQSFRWIFGTDFLIHPKGLISFRMD